MIVEDHPVFRLGLRELINEEADLTVCGDAEDIGTAWNEIQKLKPDMVIVDISLKGRNGIELIKDISKHYREMMVLVVTMHDESLYAERSLLAGARGYIMKQEASESIVTAIRHILRGEIYASDNFMRNILGKYVHQKQKTSDLPLDQLSDRELEVFQCIGKGMTTKEIARKLRLSMKTIGTYRERIKEKLNLKNAADLTRYAVHWSKVHGNLED
jgi:DNA-binding NarL/FixJ family response regulator